MSNLDVLALIHVQTAEEKPAYFVRWIAFRIVKDLFESRFADVDGGCVLVDCSDDATIGGTAKGRYRFGERFDHERAESQELRAKHKTDVYLSP